VTVESRDSVSSHDDDAPAAADDNNNKLVPVTSCLFVWASDRFKTLVGRLQ
jgi:hypothetical protein